MRWTDTRWNRLWLMGLLAVAIACADDGGGCDGGGCDSCDIFSCDDGEPTAPTYLFPEEGEVAPRAVELHLTQRAFSAIEDAVGPLIGGLLGGDGLSFCLEPQELALEPIGAFNLCSTSTCGDGTPGCELTLEVAEVNVSPLAPSRLQIELVARTEEAQVIDLTGSANCELTVLTDAFPIRLAVDFNKDPATDRVHIDIPTDELDFDLANLLIGVEGIDTLCGVANSAVPALLDVIAGEFLGPLDEILDDALGGFLCRRCGTEVPCPTGSTCLGGSCFDPLTDRCLGNDLGIEDEFDVGSLLSDFAPGLDARLGFLAYLANTADAIEAGPGRGLDLALQAGVIADAASCVPITAPPVIGPRPKSPDLHRSLTPQGNPFSIGIGIRKDFLDLALWHVWQSGVLCLEIGSETIPQLNSGLFGVLTPSLRQLTGTQTRPLFLKLKPQRAPTVRLNDSATRPDEPVLTLELRQFEIDFYTFGYGRYTRIFTLDMDIDLAIDLIPGTDGTIQIEIGDLDDAFLRVEPKNGELLAARDVDAVANNLPNLLGVFLPDLLSALEDPIALPDIAGIELRLTPDGISGIDGGQTLAIFADLEIGDLDLDLDLDLGCSAAGAGSSSALSMVLLLGLLLGLRRRRRSLRPLALGVVALVVGLFSAGCSDSGVTTSECNLNSDCPLNEWCDDGVCLPLSSAPSSTSASTAPECTRDRHCDSGEVCDDGVCVAVSGACTRDRHCDEGDICEAGACVPAQCDADADCEGCAIGRVGSCDDGRCACVVACGGGCDDAGEYCCYATNSCEELPVPCADTDCAVGTTPVPGQRAQVDTTTCEVVTPAECTCRPLPPIAFGRFGPVLDGASSADGTLRVLAAHNETYEDLVVGIADAEGQLTWEFVDGLPESGTVAGDPEGPRGGITAAGPAAGLGARVAISAEGLVAVSYQGVLENGDTGVRVALREGDDWTISDVHSGDSSGLWSVPFFLDEELWVAWTVPRIREVEDESVFANWFSEVRAQAITGAAADDEPTVLERMQLTTPCGGRCTGNFRCLAETNTCTLREQARRCDDSCGSSQECFTVEGEFVCQNVFVQGDLVELPPGAGQYLDAHVGDGQVDFVHYVREWSGLRHVTWTLESGEANGSLQISVPITGRWVDGVAVDGETLQSTGDAGRFARLGRDASGALFAAYTEAGLAELRVLDLESGEMVVVDDGLRQAPGLLEFRRVGDSVRLIPAGDGMIAIYQDATTHTVVTARRDADGEWSPPEPLGFGRTTGYFGALGFALAALPTAEGEMIDVWTWRRNIRSEPVVADVVRRRIEQ